MTNKLADWLLSELKKRNMSAREASIGADIYAGGISAYLAGKRPSPNTCEKLADYFGEPRDSILALAGHIKNTQPSDEKFVRKLTEIAVRLSEQERETALDLVRTYRDSLLRNQ